MLFLGSNKLGGCIVWNAHNTVFGSKRSAVCAQTVYFLHLVRPSVTWLNSICCLWLSDVSVICHVVNSHWTTQKMWGVFLYGVYRPGQWLWTNGRNGN